MDWQLQLHTQHHRELLEEAAELRLARDVMEDAVAQRAVAQRASAQRAEQRPAYNPALAWVGERFASLTRGLRTEARDERSAN